MAELFLSHSSADKAIALQIRDGLDTAGHHVFVDSDRDEGITPSEDWRESLRRALRLCDALVFVNSEKSQKSQWCHSELVLAGALERPIYPIDLESDATSHPVIEALQRVRRNGPFEDSISALVEALARGGLGDVTAKWDRSRAPYPGLRSFEAADVGVFFGRDAELDSLMARVDPPIPDRNGRMVVVTGPSGSGKSSLVKAGLHGRLMAEGAGWVVLESFEPTEAPTDRLITRLSRAAEGRLDEDAVRAMLDDGGLVAVARALAEQAEPPATRVLVTIDQAEQLLTNRDADEVRSFLALTSAAVGPNSPVTVVVTVRSDRLDQLHKLSSLGATMGDVQLLAPLSAEQLPVIIEGPAHRADLAFEAGVVSRLIDEAMEGSTSHAVSALPILAFTLRELYDLVEAEDERIITMAHYERIGGLAGSVGRRTEQAERALSPGALGALDEVLVRMVAIDVDLGQPTSCSLSNSGLDPAESEAVETLLDQRLITDSDGSVRLVHDQLVRSWPRLANLIVSRRDELVLQAQLKRQAIDWKAGNAEVLKPESARQAALWLKQQPSDAPELAVVRELVRRSRAIHRGRRIAAIGALVAIGIAAIFAFASARLADRRAAIQTSGRLSLLAIDQATEDPELAARLALEADSVSSTMSSRGALAAAAEGLSSRSGLLDEHTDRINGLALSPDGSLVATASDDYTIRLWDVESGAALAILIDHTDLVTDVAFSPDGTKLASGGSQGSIILWDVATRYPIATIDGHDDNVRSVTFSPDGRLVASASWDATIGLWDATTGTLVRRLDSDDGPVNQVAFSPDGAILASAGDRLATLWDVASGDVTREFAGHTALVRSVAFSPSGEVLATASTDRTARLWDLASGTNDETSNDVTLTGHSDDVNEVAFSPDGTLVATASTDQTARLWSAASGESLRTLTGHTDILTDVTFSADGTMLATSSTDATVRLWPDVFDPDSRRTFTGSADEVWDVEFSPDGTTIASASWDGDVRVWDAETGIARAVLEGHDSSVTNVAWSPDGTTVASSGTDGTVRIWDPSNGRQLQVLTDFDDVPNGLAFSPDGSTLATTDLSSVKLWDIEAGTLLRRLDDEEIDDDDTILDVAFSPDGLLLAAAGRSTTIQLWDLASDRVVRTLTGHSTEIVRVTFSPDSSLLATASLDDTARLWDVTSGRQLQTLSGHTERVWDVAFAPDGRTVATASGDHSLRLWDVDSGEPIQTLTGHTNWATAVDFSPDGGTLASAGVDRTVRLWPCFACLTRDELIREVTAQIDDTSLTEEQRARFELSG